MENFKNFLQLCKIQFETYRKERKKKIARISAKKTLKDSMYKARERDKNSKTVFYVRPNILKIAESFKILIQNILQRKTFP